jgi:hypothetical protein
MLTNKAQQEAMLANIAEFVGRCNKYGRDEGDAEVVLTDAAMRDLRAMHDIVLTLGDAAQLELFDDDDDEDADERGYCYNDVRFPCGITTVGEYMLNNVMMQHDLHKYNYNEETLMHEMGGDYSMGR